MSGALHLVSGNVPGYLIYDRKRFTRQAVSAGAAETCYSCPGYHRFFKGANGNVQSKNIRIYCPRRLILTCAASSNSPRRKPDFSRQNKGSAKGRGKQYRGQENSDNNEENDILSPKNGPLLSLASNQRYQATATPGKREKEIVELFRKVQAQLRERAAVKEEKKIEAAQQGLNERGTVDSLLKLLRKHSVGHGKKSTEEDGYDQQPERSSPFNDEQNSSFLESSNIAEETSVTEQPAPLGRPASNFRRRSPVPRVKFQPVFSAEVDDSSVTSLESQGKKKRTSAAIPDLAVEPAGTIDEDLDSISDMEPDDELSLDVPSDTSDTEEIPEEAVGSSNAETTGLSSLKLTELRDLAKSRGIKGYSKLKKSELVDLLSREVA